MARRARRLALVPSLLAVLVVPAACEPAATAPVGPVASILLVTRPADDPYRAGETLDLATVIALAEDRSRTPIPVTSLRVRWETRTSWAGAVFASGEGFTPVPVPPPDSLGRAVLSVWGGEPGAEVRSDAVLYVALE